MKLNIDCVRDVLLQCENIPLNNSLKLSELANALPKYSEDEIVYTCLKLKEADYLHIVIKQIGSATTVVKVTDITFSGHEFIEKIRPDSVFSTTKKVLGKIGVFSINMTSQVAGSVISALISQFLPEFLMNL